MRAHLPRNRSDDGLLLRAYALETVLHWKEIGLTPPQALAGLRLTPYRRATWAGVLNAVVIIAFRSPWAAWRDDASAGE